MTLTEKIAVLTLVVVSLVQSWSIGGLVLQVARCRGIMP